jgi:hypothetical protein
MSKAAARVKCGTLAFRRQRDIALMVGDMTVPDDKDSSGDDYAPRWRRLEFNLYLAKRLFHE